MRRLDPPLELPRDAAEADRLLAARLAGLEPDTLLLVGGRLDPRLLACLQADPAGWAAWPLVEGPASWRLALHRAAPPPPPHPLLRAFEEAWVETLARFREARQRWRDRRPGAREEGRRFVSGALALLEQEEGWLFPLHLGRLGEARSVRELGYEVTGARRGLEGLDALLETDPGSAPHRRALEAYEIDTFHLLEHHLRRLQAGPLPLLHRVLEPS